MRRKVLLVLGSFLAIASLGIYEYQAFVEDARRGDDPAVTYRAYHLGALGDVSIKDCRIRLSKPWFPRLENYRTLSLPGREVAFVNVDLPLQDGRAVAVSFIHSERQMRADALESAIQMGEHKVRFVRPEFDVNPGRAFAWVSETNLVVGARTKDAIRQAMDKVSIACDSTPSK